LSDILVLEVLISIMPENQIEQNKIVLDREDPNKKVAEEKF